MSFRALQVFLYNFLFRIWWRQAMCFSIIHFCSIVTIKYISERRVYVI